MTVTQPELEIELPEAAAESNYELW